MAFSLTHVDNSVSTADASSYSFTSQSFGSVAGANETRYLPVGCAAFTIADPEWPVISTIGGIASSDVISTTTESAAKAKIGIAAVPTGTTGTVEITVSGSGASGCGIDVFRLILDEPTPTAFATSEGSHSSGVVTLSLNIPTGGGAIGIVQSQSGSTTTWVGLTEASDIDIVGSAADFMSGALGTTAGTPRTITATNADTTPTNYVGCAASWPVASGTHRMFLVF